MRVFGWNAHLDYCDAIGRYMLSAPVLILNSYYYNFNNSIGYISVEETIVSFTIKPKTRKSSTPILGLNCIASYKSTLRKEPLNFSAEAMNLLLKGTLGVSNRPMIFLALTTSYSIF